MGHNLIVVESPAKARTISKYLGKEFKALASYGHVRDLKAKKGAVDPEHAFQMSYEVIERNQKHVEAIVKAAGKADALYLATDPDREGEAISWHLYEILKERGALDSKPIHRVEFYEFTKSAIRHAIDSPRELSDSLVNAQQARRALDYLVGFSLSPLLWKKIRRGLSAGRVQSPALRMIVEREEEIEAFVPREYWTLDARLLKGEQAFSARLNSLDGEKLDQFAIADGDNAAAVRQRIVDAAAGQLTVVEVARKQRRRNPSPPFTTSTLQQEAARKLGFTTQRTMRIAQQLYEGIELDGESIGLISYMRTDSVNLSGEALDEIRQYIGERFGATERPTEARTFRNKSKNAQEAHEAIRPTSILREPDAIRPSLSDEQYKLYRLIWQRTLACQMKHATYNTVAIDLSPATDDIGFRATGSTLVDPGFISVYQEGQDDQSDDDDTQRAIPPLEKGEQVNLDELVADQHFTEPPPRYSEASLVKALEAFGIGRPSTYASIISTLQDREYVKLEKKRFHPTDVGRVVNRFLSLHFAKYVDYDFTAHLEDDLDAVSRGEQDWLALMKSFWDEFSRLLAEKQDVERPDVEPLEENCPECGKPLVMRLGRNGRFIGCTGYPDCRYTRNPDNQQEEAAEEPQVVEGRSCPKCDSPLLLRNGRYGKFIGCSAYPGCRYMEPLEKPEDTGVSCPECQAGTLLKRKSRRGKIFYSCSTYPKCQYAVWNEPLAEPCPQCGHPILTLKTTKRRGTEKVCPQKECDFAEQIESPAD